MIEGENKPSERITLSEVKQQMLEYFDGEKLGSGPVLAFFDYRTSIDLHNELLERKNNLKDATGSDIGNKIHNESLLRITEFKVALHDHEITLNHSRERGYAKAYTDTETMSERLSDACWFETQAENPGSDKDTLTHLTEIKWRETIRDFSDLLMARLNQ